MRTGSTGAAQARAKRRKPRRQRPSRIPRGPRRETSPAGNTITHSPRASAARTARRLSGAGRPPRMRTGSSRSPSPPSADRKSLATMRTSRRTCPTRSSSASASSAPDGWLATISSRPCAGIRARSASLASYPAPRWRIATATKSKPRTCRLAARKASISSSRDQRAMPRSSGRASAAQRPRNQCGKRCCRRCSSSIIAMGHRRIGQQPAWQPGQSGFTRVTRR